MPGASRPGLPVGAWMPRCAERRRNAKASGPFRLARNPSDGLSGVVVVVHRVRGFRFVIYTLDHEPAHVHVTGAGQAKVNLLGPKAVPELVYSVGIGCADMRRLMAEIVEHRERLLAEWERIHGRAD